MSMQFDTSIHSTCHKISGKRLGRRPWLYLAERLQWFDSGADGAPVVQGLFNRPQLACVQAQ
ncbi:MAG: hypothetical protein R3F19_30595 [Verrucomicrobiales bacterium]